MFTNDDLNGERITKVLPQAMSDIAKRINACQYAVNQTRTSWLIADGSFRAYPEPEHFSNGHVGTLGAWLIYLAQLSIQSLITRPGLVGVGTAEGHGYTIISYYRKPDFTEWSNIGELLVDAGYPGAQWDPALSLPPSPYKSKYPWAYPDIWFQLRDTVMLLHFFDILVYLGLAGSYEPADRRRYSLRFGASAHDQLDIAGTVEDVWTPMVGYPNPPHPIWPAGAQIYGWTANVDPLPFLKHFFKVGFYGLGSAIEPWTIWTADHGAVQSHYGRAIKCQSSNALRIRSTPVDVFHGSILNPLYWNYNYTIGDMYIASGDNSLHFHDTLGNVWVLGPNAQGDLVSAIAVPVILGDPPIEYGLLCDTSDYQDQPWQLASYNGIDGGGFVKAGELSGPSPLHYTFHCSNDL